MEERSRFDRCSWGGCSASCVDEIELCWYHFRIAGETFIEHRSIFGSKALRESNQRRESVRERDVASPTKEDWWRTRSVVYYVRTGDFVKIGYTAHLYERIGGLRVERDALLAAEPGWRDEEANRHQQFAAERQGRRENFNPSRRLLSHIDAVRAEHGEPWAFTKQRVQAAGPQPLHG